MFYPGMYFPGDILQEGGYLKLLIIIINTLCKTIHTVGSALCIIPVTSEHLKSFTTLSILGFIIQQIRLTAWMQGLKKWIKYTTELLGTCGQAVVIMRWVQTLQCIYDLFFPSARTCLNFAPLDIREKIFYKAFFVVTLFSTKPITGS